MGVIYNANASDDPSTIFGQQLLLMPSALCLSASHDPSLRKKPGAFICSNGNAR